MTTETEQQQPMTAEQRTAKRAEQQARILPALRKLMPQVVQVGRAYQGMYPVETTAPEVIDAVTVPVPYRTFMLLSSLGAILVADAVEKDAAPAAAPAA